MFFRSKRPPRPAQVARRKSRLPQLEQYEQRNLNAVTASVIGGVLKVRGDSASETITVRTNGTSAVTVSGTGMTATNFLRSKFNTIEIGAQGGNDTVNVELRNQAFDRVSIWGDSGNDNLLTVLAAAQIRTLQLDGGSGNDMTFVSGFNSAYQVVNAETVRRPVNEAQAELRNSSLHNEMNSMWYQVTAAPIRSSAGNRSAALTRDVIDQFNVQYDSAARYRPQANYPDTRCNIFAGDVARAMNAPLPTKEEYKGLRGDKMTIGASDTNKWLNSQDAVNRGWRKINLNSASDRAYLLSAVKAGKLALASQPNHVAVLRPDQSLSTLTTANIGQLQIAQAGARNYNNATLQTGFGAVVSVQFFVHE